MASLIRLQRLWLPGQLQINGIINCDGTAIPVDCFFYRVMERFPDAFHDGDMVRVSSDQRSVFSGCQDPLPVKQGIPRIGKTVFIRDFRYRCCPVFRKPGRFCRLLFVIRIIVLSIGMLYGFG